MESKQAIKQEIEDVVVDTDKIIKGIPSVNQWKLVVQRIKKNRIAVLCFQYVILNTLIAIFYPVFMSEGPTSLAASQTRKLGGGANAFSNLKYPFGTGQIGTNTFTRVLAGSETSMLVGVLSTLIALVIGVILGLLAGYYKGYVEEIVMRLTDFFLAIPFLIIALVMVKLITSSSNPVFKNMSQIAAITLILGLFGWAGLARLVTANTKQVASLEYVHAAKIIGARDRSILFSHIFPNILAPVVILGALFVGGGILSEAGLSFLGFGDPINTISWGVDVAVSRPRMIDHPEQALLPGFAIFFLVLAINLLGDALRDALDPRLRD